MTSWLIWSLNGCEIDQGDGGRDNLKESSKINSCVWYEFKSKVAYCFRLKKLFLVMLLNMVFDKISKILA